MPRTSYALKTLGSSTGRDANRDACVQRRPGGLCGKADRGAAERCACRARAAWYAVGRAARGEGDADRGPLQHSTRQAGDICAVRRRCQMRVSQFACLFVSFRCFWSKRSSFPPDRVLRADERESSPTPEVRTGRVFWLGKRRGGDLQGERAERCGPGLTQATPLRRYGDGVIVTFGEQ